MLTPDQERLTCLHEAIDDALFAYTSDNNGPYEFFKKPADPEAVYVNVFETNMIVDGEPKPDYTYRISFEVSQAT